MCRVTNINYPIPPKKNICNSLCLCVGEVLLKQWKQGNTLFSKTRKRPLEIVVFFFCKLITFIDLPYRCKCSSKYKKCSGCVVGLSTLSCFTLPYQSHTNTYGLNSTSRVSGLFLSISFRDFLLESKSL